MRLSDRVGREPRWIPLLDEGVAVSIELSAALAQLSDADRETLLLTAWEGLEPNEAAVSLGISAPAFRMRLTRARRRLRTAMASTDVGGRVVDVVKDGGTNAQ